MSISSCRCMSIQLEIYVYFQLEIYISSWKYIFLAGDIYLQLEIYISCWGYLKLDHFCSQIYTSSLQRLQNANSQEIVQISISCWKKTYEVNGYLRLDNLSHSKFRTKIMSTKSNFWIQSKCLSLSRDICLSSWRYMSSSSWRCISLAGDIYLLLEIYISCWQYLQQDDFYSYIYTSRPWFLQHANSYKIVKKKTYDLMNISGQTI